MPFFVKFNIVSNTKDFNFYQQPIENLLSQVLDFVNLYYPAIIFSHNIKISDVKISAVITFIDVFRRDMFMSDLVNNFLVENVQYIPIKTMTRSSSNSRLTLNISGGFIPRDTSGKKSQQKRN